MREAGKRTSQINVRHGHSRRDHKSRVYGIWEEMTARCNNPDRKAYDHYGGRGISICERWKKFENFLTDMGEPPSDKHTLERIDNNRDYQPDNCIWATRKQQARNTSRNRLITFNNKTQCLSAWAEEYGLSPATLYKRIVALDWPIKEAFTAPPNSTKSLVQCAWCGTKFLKPRKRITQTLKQQRQHACSRSCASKLTNEERRCEPTTVNAAHTRKDKEKFPEKAHARYLVRQAVKTGKLVPLEECEFCDSDNHVEAHHPDHSRPFFLLYLCKDCHSDADDSIDKWENLATDYSGCIT